MIAVIGQGYVGLPLAIAVTKKFSKVIGFDNNIGKINDLNLGISGIEDLSNEQIKDALKSGRYKATTNPSEISGAEIYLICVPTPLSENRKPDLTYLINATETVAKVMKPGSLIIIESTIEPGTTRNVVVPILEKFSNLQRENFFVAFSPERIDPVNRQWTIENTPKLVAGLNRLAAEKALNFYSSFIKKVDLCESLEVAETAKLLENSFRLINISFINEFSKFCHQIDIDVNDVIRAASTKPYGFMPFYPSIGVGGHCIPVDPLYLAEAAREVGAPTRFIDLANEINQSMPSYFVQRATEIIGDLNGKRVLVLGVAYKPNVADTRETPVKVLIEGLRKLGALVSWHDDLVQNWKSETSVEISNNFDLAILATPHNDIDLTKLGGVPLLNTRETGSAHNSDKALK